MVERVKRVQMESATTQTQWTFVPACDFRADVDDVQRYLAELAEQGQVTEELRQAAARMMATQSEAWSSENEPWSVNQQRAWNIMRNHLRVLQRALREPQVWQCGFFVVCEDDVHLHLNFERLLVNHIVPKMQQRSLDVVLLGSLVLPSATAGDNHDADADVLPVLHPYGADHWGTQAYALSVEYAQRVLQCFTLEYGLTHALSDVAPFAADWTITKLASPERRAYCVPMLAVEELPSWLLTSSSSSSPSAPLRTEAEQCHDRFHIACHQAHYDPNLYTA